MSVLSNHMPEMLELSSSRDTSIAESRAPPQRSYATMRLPLESAVKGYVLRAVARFTRKGVCVEMFLRPVGHPDGRVVRPYAGGPVFTSVSFDIGVWGMQDDLYVLVRHIVFHSF